MPQFDPSSYSMQLFWLAVTFIALYVAMAMVALPRISTVLEERQRRIDDNLDKAQALNAEAEAAVALYEQALAKAQAEAREVLKANAEKLASEAEARQSALAAKLEARISEGEARIAAAKAEALSQVRGIAIEVARDASARLSGLGLDDAKIEGAVAAALQERR